MAKKKQVSTQPAEERHVCGECGHAYGHCFPDENGEPLSCRCEIEREYLIPCQRNACGRWIEKRNPEEA